MADIPVPARAQILATVRDEQTRLRALRDQTNVMDGYLGFDIPLQALGHCHEAIAGTLDRENIAHGLRAAVLVLGQHDGDGPATPAIRHARETFTGILQGLEG